MPDSARLRQVLRSIERRGVTLDNRSLALVRTYYRQLDLTSLLELLDTITLIASRAKRVSYLDSLMEHFERLVAVLGQPPPGTRELIQSAVQLGARSVGELTEAAYDLPADRELAYVSRSAARLDHYWPLEVGPGGRFSGQVREVLMQGLDRGQTRPQMEQALIARTGVSRSRATLIVRNEVGSAQAAASEGEQTELGYTHFTWTTAHDSRVRPSHRALDGKVFAWDNLPAIGSPGEPILCRCVAVPYVGTPPGSGGNSA